MGYRKYFMSTRERALAGAIVTLVNTETGETRVELAQGFHFETGSHDLRSPHHFNLNEALLRLLAEADKWDGTWRVRTISTPQTILADIRGRQPGAQGARSLAPESMILTSIGRIDMWEGHHANVAHARARARKRKEKAA